MKRDWFESIADDMKDIEKIIADTFTERPISFRVGKKCMNIYPITLGKVFILQSLTKEIGFDNLNISINPVKEVLTKVRNNKELCARFLAYNTAEGKDEVFNTNIINSRTAILTAISDEDLASLLITTISSNNILNKLCKHYKMEKEDDKKKQVIKAKDNRNTYSFGGLSVYGSLIDTACCRYGWSYQYVLWGISYTNLMLMLKDKIDTVYLTDDERKRVRFSNDKNTISGDDKEQMENFIRSQKWT